MPTYEYRCDVCGHTIEAHRKMAERKLPAGQCSNPTCREGEMLLIPSMPQEPQFKGTGFYQTDYANKDKKKKHA